MGKLKFIHYNPDHVVVRVNNNLYKFDKADDDMLRIARYPDNHELVSATRVGHLQPYLEKSESIALLADFYLITGISSALLMYLHNIASNVCIYLVLHTNVKYALIFYERGCNYKSCKIYVPSEDRWLIHNIPYECVGVASANVLSEEETQYIKEHTAFIHSLSNGVARLEMVTNSNGHPAI
jgi:hypothetical protein